MLTPLDIPHSMFYVTFTDEAKEAAENSSIELFSYLVSIGADVNIYTCDGMTPLQLLCMHGNPKVSAPAQIDAIRTLIAAGIDLEDQVATASHFGSVKQFRGLLQVEGVPQTSLESPAIYLFNEVVRLVHPEYLDSTWWGNRLSEAIFWAPNPAPIRDAIMKFCDMSAVREAFWWLTDGWPFEAIFLPGTTAVSPDRKWMTIIEDCRVLMSRLKLMDTLHFKMRAPYPSTYSDVGAFYCLTTMALRSPLGWSVYLTALQQMDMDLEEFARQEVAILNEIEYSGGGWTEEAVVKLYAHTKKPIIELPDKVWIECVRKGFNVNDGWHDGWIDRGGREMWAQATEQIRLGKSPYGPFDEVEQLVYERWQRVVRISNEQGICYWCQGRMERERAKEEQDKERRKLDEEAERRELDSYNWIFESGRT
ncbi:hypothetical protein H2199_007984 [Coniosporium tulheliwenetii]|uniref:Uncharacterized protein n=1 Tax=Coniosporium tulheliwenetii TaxID=3383036 RepID=A0ACC2YLY6_9PEZI|nr:hypothetical protein H2199_007984 [Cladosporium sp. JES 115]